MLENRDAPQRHQRQVIKVEREIKTLNALLIVQRVKLDIAREKLGLWNELGLGDIVVVAGEEPDTSLIGVDTSKILQGAPGVDGADLTTDNQLQGGKSVSRKKGA